LNARHLATGDFSGHLNIYDLENPKLPIYSVKAHEQIINAIDGCGGMGINSGPPELATASRDGTIKIWDTRQRDRPVAKISPPEGDSPRDAWAVAFGNSYNNEERVVGAGYENGDLKLFDLKAMSLLWETNVSNGVCSIEFDRKDIKMNKMTVTTLEASFLVYDLRTKHSSLGYSSVKTKVTLKSADNDS
jgi:WD40 repeat protein